MPVTTKELTTVLKPDWCPGCGDFAILNGLKAAGVLNNGQANSLIVKLNHAIDSLTTKPDQPTACNQLQAFVNEVNAYVNGGKLTPAQADLLLGGPLGILAIMAAIPC